MTGEYDVVTPRDLDYYAVFEGIPEADRAWWQRARDYASAGLEDRMTGHWEREEYPVDLVAQAGAQGLLTDGVDVSSLGMETLSPLAAGIVNMETSRIDGSLGTALAVQGGLALRTLMLFGSEAQIAQYGTALAKAETLGSFALTEPAHGSDSVSLETTATLHGDEFSGHYVINGSKKWIGNGASGGITFTWARVQGGQYDGSVRCFLIPQDTPGYSAEVITSKATLRAVHQAEIHYQDLRAEADAVLPGSRSFKDTARVLFATRFGVAWSAVGHAAACVETALNYATQREQFSKPIGGHQLVQERLSWMVSELTSMQLHVKQVTQLDAEGRLTGPQASMAKYHNTRKARQIAQVARDMLGGNGVLLHNKVARHMADIEGIHTYEGTESVQSLIIGRDLTGYSAFA